MKLNLSKDLGPLRVNATGRINDEAARRRAGIVTPGVPYAEKLEEATSYLAASPGQRQNWSFVYLASEAEATGVTIEELASKIVSRARECREMLAVVESARQLALRRIREASSPAAIDAVEIPED